MSDYDDVSDDLPYYAKNHLVPFGEYKPLPFLTEPLYKLMNMPLADFRRGGAAQAPLTMKGQKVAFNICYEDGFGDELIATAKNATLCFGLFCCVACCWVSRAARLLFYRITPLIKQDPLVGVVWGGVLCENCIVDANAIKKQQ